MRTRLLTHFRAEYPHDKSARMIAEAADVAWDYEPSEFAACLTELRLIKRWRPRYNVAMKRDARHYAFVRLSPGPAPKLHVVRGSQGSDAATYFGPFHGARQLDEALRELNDAMGLRDCALDTRMHFADQVELPVATARTTAPAGRANPRRWAISVALIISVASVVFRFVPPRGLLPRSIG